MVQFCSLIDKTVDLLHDTLTKINGKIVQRTSSKANAFNLMPALTEYITTENSLDTVSSYTLCRQHNKIDPSMLSDMFHNITDTIRPVMHSIMGLSSSLYIVDGSGTTIDTRVGNKCY